MHFPVTSYITKHLYTAGNTVFCSYMIADTLVSLYILAPNLRKVQFTLFAYSSVF